MKVRFGADEIILWLRKNGKSRDVANDGVGGLGRKVHDLICNELNGRKIEDDAPSYWPGVDGDHHIGKYDLPRTSAQYVIEIDRVNDLYRALVNW